MNTNLRFISSSFFLLLALLSSAVFAQARFQFAAAPGNLSKDVVPVHYRLSLALDPAKDTFSGTAAITIRVARATPSFPIHAHELTAQSAVLTAVNGQPRPLSVQPTKLPQAWQLSATDGLPLPAGEYVLHIHYTGKVQATGSGLFKVPYTARGQPALMLATQLEAVFARMLFPCFDEPAFRAVFEISVASPSAFEVHSNMPRTASSTKDGVTEHHFAPTPSMPTYLVAITVGRFATVRGETAGIPLRIFTAEGKQEQAAYAMAITKRLVPYFTDYFGVPYSLPKLDQLAVPGTRDGAMEDWGLISYSEDAILFNPARSSFNAQRQVFNIVAHEIAHQWFGNLVTAAAWEEIWLNEAFATWMETKASEHFNPLWHERLRRRRWLDQTMAGDAGEATHAIRAGTVSESSVFDVFDSITYNKGGAVLAMLEEWIGNKTFRDGLARYMKDRQFSNATAGDLWHHMQLASGKTVSDVAASWTDQQGFPVVHVATRCNDGRTVVQMSQSRFSLAAQALPPQQWKIPVVLAQGAERRSLLMDQSTGSAAFDGCSNLPVLANPDGLGYYRVAYDPATLQRLTASFARLTPAQQVVLLSDAFALAQAGLVTMPQYFGLLAVVPEVTGGAKGVLLSLAIDHLMFLQAATAGTPAHAGVQSAARALLGPALARLGWNPVRAESADNASLRSDLISHLAQFGDTAVIARATRLFDASVTNGAPLPAATRSAIITAAAVGADRVRFDRMLAALQSTDSEEDRWVYAQALASMRDGKLAAALLSSTVVPGGAPNVVTRIPGMMAERSPHGALAYQFTLDHWPKLAARASNLFGESSQLLPNAAASFNEEARAQQLVADQARVAGADGKVSAQRIASRIELQARVRRRDAEALAAFLAHWQPGVGGGR